MKATINDFSPEGYKEMLKAALASGYNFLSFSDTARFTAEKVCLLRHDIDADLEAARDMALMESRVGVRATYFLMLRSPIYNLFGRANSQFVHQIIAARTLAGAYGMRRRFIIFSP